MRVKIPNHKKVDSGSDSHTVFCIEVETGSSHYVIHKRYKEFSKLHHLLSSLKHPQADFPSKSILKWSRKILEHRRTMFEHYLNTLLSTADPPQAVLDFLATERDQGTNGQASSQPMREEKGCKLMFNQPIICFNSHDQSLFVPSYEDDMIVSSVISALYDDNRYT